MKFCMNIGMCDPGHYAPLAKAAEEVGFVYIVGHGVDPALIQRVLDRADAFCARVLGD